MFARESTYKRISHVDANSSFLRVQVGLEQSEQASVFRRATRVWRHNRRHVLKLSDELGMLATHEAKSVPADNVHDFRDFIQLTGFYTGHVILSLGCNVTLSV